MKKENLGKTVFWILAFLLLSGFGYFLEHAMVKPSQTTQALSQPTSTSSPAGKVYVRIEGNVKNPGVYSLPKGAMVMDVIEKAGGLPANYDTSQLDVAMTQLVENNQLIIIP